MCEEWPIVNGCRIIAAAEARQGRLESAKFATAWIKLVKAARPDARWQDELAAIGRDRMKQIQSRVGVYRSEAAIAAAMQNNTLTTADQTLSEFSI
ncbi:hypothetical protein RsS62_09310 [Rhizobium dioscoreae]|nr:hypothetical protein RsS62_09310 [Rhizobium dioscoreae]